ncbi:MAG: helicase-associated domain-containing protein [Corynebacterium sp.]|nr:helicase-associated domain-containing protein [Corynebacterium sp.]
MRPPTFSHWLAHRDDAQLRALLARRPDAATPPPPSFRSLGARLRLRESLVPALTHATAPMCAVITAAGHLHAEINPCNTPEVVEEIRRFGLPLPDPSTITAAIDDLVNLAILYGDEDTGYLLIDEAYQLLPTHLFPDEHTDPTATPLPLTDPAASLRATLPYPKRLIAATAATGAEIIHLTRRLLDTLATTPLPTLKSGGLPRRLESQLATQLRCDETALRRLVSLAAAAGLIATGVPVPVPAEDTGGNYIAPTAAADDFLDSELAAQWVTLAAGWLASDHAPWRTGRLLSSDIITPRLAKLRTLLAHALTRVPDNTAVSRDDLLAILLYDHPLFTHRAPTRTLTELLGEAAWLGLIATTGDEVIPTPLLTALVNGTEAAAVTVAATLIPDTTDTLIAQSDHTLVATGPLDAATLAPLEAIADLESPGLAAVYRVSERSLQRGLSTGFSADDITGFLSTHVLGEVPASLTYLVTDVARRHGLLRVGAATSYLRSDDPALLAEAARTIEGVRLIAPTVALTDLPVPRLIRLLREAGLSPLAETAAGELMTVTAPRSRIGTHTRTPHRRSRTLTESELTRIIDLLRAREAPEPASTEIVPALRAAQRARSTLTIRYAGLHGETSELTLQPLTLSAGDVDGCEPATGQIRRIPLSRIIALVAPHTKE